MIDWLKAIADNQLPASLEIDEEGCFFLCLTTRSHFVRKFCRCLEYWLEHDYAPEGWHKVWREDDPENAFTNLHNLDIAGLKAKIKAAGFI